MLTRRELLNTASVYGASCVLFSGNAQTQQSTNLTQLSLARAGELLRRKTISPVELTQASLARIEHLNPILNAFITVTAEQALDQAREAEDEIRRGRWRGPLHGIPLALKDLIDTAGIRTTAASAVFKDRIPTDDAEVVRRLKAAGAVLLGKLNMHEFGCGGTSVPSYYGAVHNPWNLDRIAGGSSGGSAAAVAAGMCFGALGSDTAGSVRQPAAYCGVVGLKPTYGRVSNRGVVPLSWSMDHIGPICRSAMDAALVLEAIAGYDALESSSVDWAVDHFASVMSHKATRVRVGLLRRPYFEQLDPDIEAAVNSAVQVLAKFTSEVREVEFSYPNVLGLIVSAECYAFHSPWFAKTPELYQPMTRQRLQFFGNTPASSYAIARREMDRQRRQADGAFSAVDVLVTPTTVISPITIEAGGVDLPLPPDGTPLEIRNTQAFDASGLPAISVPCGFTRTGMPIGLQIVGPRFGEARVLALAHRYQQETDWHMRRPPI